MTILGRSTASPAPSPSLPTHHHHGHHRLHFHRPPLDSGASSSFPSTSSSTVEFSPPLIAMVVVVVAALLVITYSRLISRSVVLLLRRWRRRRRRRYFPNSSPSSTGGGDRFDSPPPMFDSPDEFHHLYYHNYGLDESVIKTIPISLYAKSGSPAATRDCAVCLLEFEHDRDYVRTLPNCAHAFHVDCIDIWLRSHANCPLCRAGIFLPSPPLFVPLMAARIRPSFVENPNFLLPDLEFQPPAIRESSEITPCIEDDDEEIRISDFGLDSSRMNNNFNLLKRSYSFGFERSERMTLATEPATVSPWRSSRRSSSSAWSKRPSPFGSYMSKPRLFSSFRYYYKSPFSRRRSIGSGGIAGGGGFFPLSERITRSGHSRRSKSMTSPRFFRPSSSVFSSSRLRCGDPEALISPDRYSRR
ncbi:RING-H2 finger protein ATL65 [Linum perenne]